MRDRNRDGVRAQGLRDSDSEVYLDGAVAGVGPGEEWAGGSS